MYIAIVDGVSVIASSTGRGKPAPILKPPDERMQMGKYVRNLNSVHLFGERL